VIERNTFMRLTTWAFIDLSPKVWADRSSTLLAPVPGKTVRILELAPFWARPF
jgi:hypothetical protein